MVSEHHGRYVRAKWIGPMRERYALLPDQEGRFQRVKVGEEPAAYAQWRHPETGQVQTIPASDLDDHAWDALPSEARAAVRDSGLYDVETDEVAAARRRQGRERAGAVGAMEGGS